MGDIQCEKCGYVDADYKFIHLPEYVGDADLQCHSCGGIICGLEADRQARCLAAEAERDALTVELATVKAALPRWRLHEDRKWVLWLNDMLLAGVVESDGFVWFGQIPRRSCAMHNTREAAMLAVTEALGLPPCEVCDE